MESRNIVDLRTELERNDVKSVSFQRQLHVTHSLVSRLSLEKELEGHNGCVNCLEWNDTGELLASGSDDCQIIIWNPHTCQKLKSVQSGHQGNIFSVKFLPGSNSQILASCAADGKVRVHDLTSSEIILSCSCHDSRVKRLVTAPGLPSMFWSAGEDGKILQFDLREPHHCPSANVLVDLTAQFGTSAEAKCLAISPMRPEMLAVGSNDPYIRLYDRRLIPNLEEHIRLSDEVPISIRQNMDRNCATYFIAGHLPQKRHYYRKKMRQLTCTYVAFNPNGRELLANLGGEQIYLFDVFNSSFPKEFRSCPDYELQRDTAPCFSNAQESNAESDLPPKLEMIKTQANEYFHKCHYTGAIELYNVALNMKPRSAVLFGNRAAAFLKRGWDGDLYAALRDCHSSLAVDSTYFKSHFRMAKCLYELHWHKEAQSCLLAFKNKFPHEGKTKATADLLQDIETALQACQKKDKDCGCERKDSMTDSNSDADDEGSRSSDSDQGADWCANIGGHAQNNNLSDNEREWRGLARDYKLRFCGHCNTTTDIKEANFFGSNGQFVMAGSDDGYFFIWDKETTNIVKVLKGDDSIVNCLQPHPTICRLATSGIDSVVRLWSPRPEDGTKDERTVDDSEGAINANQRRMNANPLEVMLMHMGYRIPQSLEEEEALPENQRDHGPVQCRTS